MKILALAVATACTALAPAAFAQNYDRYRYREDTARVVSSTPVYAAGETREECWNPRAGHYEERRDSHGGGNTVGGTVAGAVIGGIIGHQFNDRAGTALGALAGGAAGHEIAKNRGSNEDQDDLDYSRCRSVSAGSGDVVGYDVTYDYRGQQYTTRLDHDPGRRLALGREIRDDGMPFDADVAYSTPSTPSYSYDDRRWR